MAKKKNGLTSAYPGQQDWQAESDHNTMTRAAEIKKDPSRMKGVMRHQAKQVKALQSVGSDISNSGIRKTKEYKGVMKNLKTRGC